MKLKEIFKTLITAPDYKDEQSRRVSDLLHEVTVLLLCGLTMLLSQLLWSGEYGKIAPVIIALSMLALSVSMNRRGYLRFSSNITVWSAAAFLLYMCLKYEGIRDTAVIGIPGVLVAGGLVLDRKPFFIFAVTAVLTVVLMAYLQVVGVLQNVFNQEVRYSDMVDVLVILGTTAIAIRILSDSLYSNFTRALASEREVTRQAGALSESELRYRSLFEGANDAILILERLKLLECNTMAVRMFGATSVTEIVGHFPWEFSPTKQPDGSASQRRLREIMDSVVGGPPQRFQWKFTRKDGGEFDAEVSLKCLKYGTATVLQAMVTDITERKRAEKELRESTEKFEKVFHSSPVPMIIHRLSDGVCVDVNSSFLEQIGVNSDEVVGRSATSLGPWIDQDVFARTVQTLRSQSSAKNLEGVYFTKSGSVEHSLISAETIEISGEPHILLVSVNVSEMKAAEDELKKSEGLYRTLISASPDAIIVFDKQGCVGFASDKTTEVFGEHSKEDILGRSLFEWLAEKDRERCETDLPSLLNNRTSPTMHYEVVRKDGTKVLAEMSTQALPESREGLGGYVSFVRDVTKRVEAEKEIEEKEALYRALFDLSPGGILLTDEEGNILDANAAACTTNGYSIDELLGRNVRMFIPESEQEDIDHNIAQMKSGMTLDHEVINVRKDGTLWNIELREKMISLPNGKKGILSITNDITARKVAESALQESERRYRTLVEVSPDAVIIHQDFEVVFANQAALALLGASALDEIQGRSIFEFVEVEQHAFMRDRYRALTEENARLPFAEFVFIRIDGKPVAVESAALLSTWKGRQAAQLVIHDLSERKKTETAIHESEERFRNLTRAGFEGIMIHEDGLIIDANQRFADMLGFRNPEMLVGKSALDVLTFAPESRNRFRKALTEFSDAPFEITVKRQDGSAFPAETQSRKTMYKNRPASVVALHDITKRKLAERALLESEERFRALVQNSSDVISIHNEKGIIVYVAPSVTRILGYKPSDLVGLSALEFIHPEDLEAAKSDFRDLVENRRDNIPAHFRFRAADGSWKYLESIATNLASSPAIKGYVLNTRDVTERKRAEEALRESEERFRLLIENSTDLIAEISEEGRFVYVSPNYENILGYRPADLTGKSAFEHIYPEDLPKALSNFQDEHGLEEFRVRHGTGSWRWFEASSRRFRTRAGEERSVTMSRDITDRKLAEQELNKSRTQLQRFSEHLENTLDEERKRISREIHDELGQLLTILKFDLSWLKLNVKAKSKEFPAKIQSMEDSLTQALASVKRISKELRPPQLEELGLVGAIQLDVSLIERKVGLTTKVRINPADFVIDKQLSTTIYRVFHEVLTNIVRHADARNVDILLESNPQSVTLRVEDDGRGITSKELEGTMSLGLVGMRERVRQWNGKLTIVGRKGEGTVVTAFFPL